MNQLVVEESGLSQLMEDRLARARAHLKVTEAAASEAQAKVDAASASAVRAVAGEVGKVQKPQDLAMEDIQIPSAESESKR